MRAALTMAIIAFGIMALVGILTAIDGLKSTLTTQFTMMGANTFSITSRSMRVTVGDKHYRTKNHSHITYREAMEFKKIFNEPAWVSVSFNASGLAEYRFRNNKTNPNISVIGSDENFLTISGEEIESGRNFSQEDLLGSRHVVIIGQELVRFLFPGVDPLGKEISLPGLKLTVIGVMKSKGSSMMGSDRNTIIPITTARQYFSRPNITYNIGVMPYKAISLEMMTSEAEGIFRIVRNLDPRDESDFNVQMSDSIIEILLENIKYVTLAATIIGLITLFGAAVGLMNIMLVSVTERTREIGVRKALGARKSVIRQQFLYESVIIGQMGGLMGILAGILIGNLVSLGMGSSFTIPWVWVIGGVLACFIVGMASGYFPAVKASSVDPIEALRYE
ncbi:MAG: ABC transporter permease [Bacteroidales bacterium]|nr:ABC transporter permease [Bacteroidales bacterium]